MAITGRWSCRDISITLPHLRDMMASYFHQDYDLSGPNDEAILQRYARHRGDGMVMSTVSEIEQLLSIPAEDLLARFEAETGHGNMMIGDTDAAAREWLETACMILKNAGAPGGR